MRIGAIRTKALYVTTAIARCITISTATALARRALWQDVEIRQQQDNRDQDQPVVETTNEELN